MKALKLQLHVRLTNLESKSIKISVTLSLLTIKESTFSFNMKTFSFLGPAQKIKNLLTKMYLTLSYDIFQRCHLPLLFPNYIIIKKVYSRSFHLYD